MMYDQTLNMLFQQERETIHDIAASAITCTIRASSREKLYQELDLETLQKQHWHSKSRFSHRKIVYLDHRFREKTTHHLLNIVEKVHKLFLNNLTRLIAMSHREILV